MHIDKIMNVVHRIKGCSLHVYEKYEAQRMVLVKVDIMYASWQMIEDIFFQIINHYILVAMVTNTRLIFHGYVMALYAYRHRYR